MIALISATSVEVLKLRRTLALWLVPVPPLIVMFITTINVISRGRDFAPSAGLWEWLSPMMVLFWCLFSLPLFITLETALLAGIEHRSGAWKDLFALPIPRWSIYVSKLIVAVGLVILSSLTFWLLSGFQVSLLVAINPALQTSDAIPWGEILRRFALTTTASILPIAIQAWVALRWPSFTVASAVGIAGTIVGFMLGISSTAAPYAQFIPWSEPFFTLAHSEQYQMTALLVGVLGGLIVSIAGCWEMTRRDVI